MKQHLSVERHRMRSHSSRWASACLLPLLFATSAVRAQASHSQSQAQTQTAPVPVAAPSKDDLPANVLAGMDALRSDGPDDAVKFWVKGSVLESSKDALTQANNLRDIQGTFGRFQYFDLIRLQDLSSRVRVAYMVMNYERGPLFARFVLYHATPGWVPVSFQFDTDDTKILPLSQQ